MWERALNLSSLKLVFFVCKARHGSSGLLCIIHVHLVIIVSSESSLTANPQSRARLFPAGGLPNTPLNIPETSLLGVEAEYWFSFRCSGFTTFSIQWFMIHLYMFTMIHDSFYMVKSLLLIHWSLFIIHDSPSSEAENSWTPLTFRTRVHPPTLSWHRTSGDKDFNFKIGLNYKIEHRVRFFKM